MKKFTFLFKGALMLLCFLYSLSNQSQTCGSTISTFPYSEGFEIDNGGWTQDGGDNFDWTRDSAGTPSSNTGPSTGNGSTWYMYTESSSPNYPSRTANLESPCFDLTSASSAQFSFYYHMYGAAMGTLNVDLSTDNGSTYPTNLWSISGQQQGSNGAAYILVNIDLTPHVGQTIKIRFATTTGSNYTGDMAIDDIGLTAVTTPMPEINITGLGNNILSGDITPSTTDDTDYGPIGIGVPAVHTFTIQNNGTLPLNIGAITYSGANAAEYSITTAPAASISAGGSTTFDVQVLALAAGLRTATISIANNDTTGGENPYTFALQGSASTPAPEINITGLGNSIVSGDVSPVTTDDTDYGNVNIGISPYHTFTIQNLGSIPLSVGAITFTGPNAVEFSVITLPAASVASGGSTTFDVQFSPLAAGLRTATISIVNNDSSGGENPYTFALQGTGVVGPPLYTIYYENFDENNGSWTASTGSSTNWLYGTGLSSASESGEGSYWYSNSYNDYANNAYATVESPIISTSGFNNLKFSADIRYNCNADDDDGMIVQYRKRTAGIWSSWTILGSSGAANSTNWYDGNGIVDAIASGSDGWTGDSTSGTIANHFQTAIIELPTILENSSEIQFRFVFASDGSTTDDGVAMDNVIIYADPITPYSDPTYGPGSITTNLKLWLKATNEIGATSNGADIVTWDDSAFDNNAIATTSNSPSFEDNATENINFNPVIKFDRSNTEFMRGKGGFSSHDYFVVMKSNGTIDYNAGNRQVPIAGRVSTSTFYNDGTGLGLCNISARFSNEVVAHMSSSVPGSVTPPSDQNWGRALTSTSINYVDEVIIYNVKTDPAHTITEIYKNGVRIDNTTATTNASPYPDLNFSEFINQQFYVGVGRFSLNGNVAAYVDGKINEIISYADTNSDVNQQKILSYLAIKNGITLHAPNSVTADNLNDVDYVDSAGKVIWDTSANGSYNYDVAGIGRDDASQLNQKQSKSINSTGVVTIGLGDISATNSTNTNTFNTDRDYLMWGNNAAALSGSDLLTVDLGASSTSVTTLFDRRWKIVESRPTGSNDILDVKVSIPASVLPALSDPTTEEYAMIVSASSDFNSLDIVDVIPLTPNGANYETWYDFDNTRFFTFGIASKIAGKYEVDFSVGDFLVGESSVHLNSSFSVSSWVKNLGSGGTYASKGSAYEFKIDGSGKVQAIINGTTRLTSNTTVNDSKWHHIAFTYTGSTLRLYIDGVEDGNSPATSVPVPTSTNDKFAIGVLYTDKHNITSEFDGSIDEIRIWDAALSQVEIQYIMNQEIIEHTDNTVNGSIIPQNITRNEVNSIPWNDLQAYHNINGFYGTTVQDGSNNDHWVRIKYLVPGKAIIDNQPSPLPYGSNGTGSWDTSTTWKDGAGLYIPGSASIVDPNITVDWNIVSVSHNVTMDNTSLPAANNNNRTLLGLIADSTKELTISSDNGLTITHYLELNGLIDLEGESQLIQSDKSVLVVGANGSIERDQQGTADTYTYNYWSSPVGVVNTAATNDTYTFNYTVPDVLRDGTNPASPGAITFLTSGYNGSSSPFSIADYWIWKFANGPDDDYYFWQHTRSTGTVNAGEGFTMKGPGTGSISTPQNYVFIGKPNNGDITLNISSGNDYLVGNPYPSALDAHEFISDNPDTSGTIYYWEHWGGGSHHSFDYQGGYALYNYSGGIPTASYGTNDPDVGSGGTPTKLPGQYIPVSQGFFVYSPGGGTINFENDQRVFEKEGATSTFVRMDADPTEQATNYNEDTRMKFRIGFDSFNLIHRQLLLTIDEHASSGYDWGYDGKLNSQQMDDMFWMIDGEKYGIQGIDVVTAETVVPLGVHVRDNGYNSIRIDHLENVPDHVQVYVRDKELNIYHDLRESQYDVNLNAGDYFERFEIVFSNRQTALDTDDLELTASFEVFYNGNDKTLVIKNNKLIGIDSIELFNILGQSIFNSNEIELQSLTEIKVPKISSGTYIINLDTVNGKLSKKVLVE